MSKLYTSRTQYPVIGIFLYTIQKTACARKHWITILFRALFQFTYYQINPILFRMNTHNVRENDESSVVRAMLPEDTTPSWPMFFAIM